MVDYTFYLLQLQENRWMVAFGSKSDDENLMHYWNGDRAIAQKYPLVRVYKKWHVQLTNQQAGHIYATQEVFNWSITHTPSKVRGGFITRVDDKNAFRMFKALRKVPIYDVQKQLQKIDYDEYLGEKS